MTFDLSCQKSEKGKDSRGKEMGGCEPDWPLLGGVGKGTKKGRREQGNAVEGEGRKSKLW